MFNVRIIFIVGNLFSEEFYLVVYIFVFDTWKTV